MTAWRRTTVALIGALTVGAGLTAVASPAAAAGPPLSGMSEEFNSLDPARWQNDGGASINNGKLRLAVNNSYNGVVRQIPVGSLDETTSQVQLATAPNQGNGTTNAYYGLYVAGPTANEVEFVYEGGRLYAKRWENGTGTIVNSVAYNATNHQYLRFREAGSTVYWETSPNGTGNWTSIGQWNPTFAVTDLHVVLGAGHYGAESSPGVVEFDNFNYTPVAQSADTATHDEFAYGGTWGNDSAEHWSNQAGATATINAKIGAGGGTVSVRGWKGPGNGIVAVSADGGAETNVDLYAANWTEVNYWTTPTLPAGDHVIKVRITGNKNAAATGTHGSVTGASTTNGVLSKPAGGTTPPPTEPPPPTGGTSGDWLSGGAGNGIDGGDTAFGNWRGSGIESMSTWADSQDACENQWGLQSGGPVGNFNGPTIVAIGGKWGQSWSDAANGGMDQIWTNCLNALNNSWGTRADSNLYISLFHEANGNWYEWSIGNELANFKAAFARFENLQEQIMPDAQLVYALNAESVDSPYSLAEGLPNSDDYDVLGFDMYSMHSHVDFDQFPALAASVGKPLVLQEWGIKNDEGGGANFVQYMRDNIVQHGGTGPGKLIMENYFNIGEYQIYPSTSSPQGAARYQSLW